MDNKLQNISRGAIIVMSFALLSLNIFLFPELAREEIVAGNIQPVQTLPYLFGAWIISVPLFVAFHKTYKLIISLRGNKAFSKQSLSLLHVIKTCVVIFNVLVIAAAVSVVVSVRMSDPTEDVTPFVMLGIIFTGVSMVITTFITVLQKLLYEAIRMKSENELTI